MLIGSVTYCFIAKIGAPFKPTVLPAGKFAQLGTLKIPAGWEKRYSVYKKIIAFNVNYYVFFDV